MKTIDYWVLVPFMVPETVPEQADFMSSRIRYFKEQRGHFYTRMAVPERLVAIFGRTQLQEALGSDRKAAERKHFAVVTKFQETIAAAEKQLALGLLKTTEAMRQHRHPTSTIHLALWLKPIIFHDVTPSSGSTDV